jgi:pectinesterase
VTIPKSKGYITLQGAGMNVTFIEYDMNAATAGSTYDSATVAVFSDYFVARDISFKVILRNSISKSHLNRSLPIF